MKGGSCWKIPPWSTRQIKSWEEQLQPVFKIQIFLPSTWTLRCTLPLPWGAAEGRCVGIARWINPRANPFASKVAVFASKKTLKCCVNETKDSLQFCQTSPLQFTSHHIHIWYHLNLGESALFSRALSFSLFSQNVIISNLVQVRPYNVDLEEHELKGTSPMLFFTTS